MKTALQTISAICFALMPFSNSAQMDATFISRIIPLQKEMISRLSGEQSIKDIIYLKQRASSEERRLTVAYLSEHLVYIG